MKTFIIKELPILWIASAHVSHDAGDGERVMPSSPRDPAPQFVDKTGLTGEYEFKLDFEGAMSGRLNSVGGPTLEEALERQLGLKLVKVKRMPVEVLVIDQADRLPVEN